jgi:hypothetical protein
VGSWCCFWCGDCLRVGWFVKKNFRIGVNISQIFPNIAIFVIDIEPAVGKKIVENMNTIRQILKLAGHGAIANKLVAEFRD